MQRHARDHKIETRRRERQELLVRRNRQPAEPRRHRGRQIAAHHVDTARAQQWRHHTPPTNIQCRRKPPRGIVQPIEQAFGNIAQHVGDAVHRVRGAFAVQPHGTPVEHLHGRVHHLPVHAPTRVAKRLTARA